MKRLPERALWSSVGDVRGTPHQRWGSTLAFISAGGLRRRSTGAPRTLEVIGRRNKLPELIVLALGRAGSESSEKHLLASRLLEGSRSIAALPVVLPDRAVKAASRSQK